MTQTSQFSLLLAGMLAFSLLFPSQHTEADDAEDYSKAYWRLLRARAQVSPPSPTTAKGTGGSHISIDEESQVTDEDLSVLGHLNPISHFTCLESSITVEGFEVLKHAEGLRTVGLSGPGVTDRVVGYLERHRQLESISLGRPRAFSLLRGNIQGTLHGETLGQFREHHKLKSLSIGRAYGLTEEGLRQIGTLEQLRELQLSGCEVNDSDLGRLTGLKRLETLNLTTNPIAGGLRVLGRLPKLKSLSLGRCLLTDEGASGLAALKNLEVLRLTDNQVGDRLLQELAAGELGNLRELYLERTDVTDDGLKHLQSFPKLKAVHLGATRVTGSGMKHLRGLPKLRSVLLAWTGLSDENARGLRHLTQVTSLNVAGTDISDASVPILAELRQLRILGVYGTQISEEGLSSLRRALPECRILNSSIDVDGLRYMLFK